MQINKTYIQSKVNQSSMFKNQSLKEALQRLKNAEKEKEDADRKYAQIKKEFMHQFFNKTQKWDRIAVIYFKLSL